MTSQTDHKRLAKFGLTLAFLLLFPGLVVPYIKYRTWHSTVLVLAAVLGIISVVRPLWFKAFEKIWMALGTFLGYINSRILLGIFFIIIIFPAAIIMRIAGVDRLKLKLNPGAKSYREPRTDTFDPSQMEKIY